MKPEVRDLAAQIYVGLVGDAAASQSSAQTSAGAPRLSQLSFELAEAFQRVHEQLNAANLPKNQDFMFDIDSIAAWSKPR